MFFQSAKIGKDIKNSVSLSNFYLSMSAKIKLKSSLSKIANSQSVLHIILAALWVGAFSNKASSPKDWPVNKVFNSIF